MKNYVGTYRVVCEFNRKTLKPIKGDTYIYCAKGGQIYRYNSDTLVYYRQGKNQSNKIIQGLIDRGINIVKDCSTAYDIQFQFKEKDIGIIAKIFKARVTGKSIKPTSKRNLRLFNWYKKIKSGNKVKVKDKINELDNKEVQLHFKVKTIL